MKLSFHLALTLLCLVSLSTSISNKLQAQLHSLKVKKTLKFTNLKAKSESDSSAILSSQDICNNLYEVLLTFGPSAFHLYSSVPDKFVLLGGGNTALKKNSPEGFRNLALALCQFKIEKDPSHPLPSDVRYFITQTISRCLKSTTMPSEIFEYKCPSLDLQTKLVMDKNAFCNDLETVSHFDKAFDSSDNTQGSPFKVHKFLNKGSGKYCYDIVELYNYCIYVSIALKLDSKQCFTNEFSLYSEGGRIRKVNDKTENKCSNAVLPYFSLMSIQQDLLKPANSFGFCDTIDHKVKEILQTKQYESKLNISYLQGNETIFKNNIDSLKSLKENLIQLVQEVKNIEDQWKELYSILTQDETLSAINLTRIFATNVKLLNNSMVDWIMTSRFSLQYMDLFQANQTLLANYTTLSENFQKIHQLSSLILNYTSFLQSLILSNKAVPINNQMNFGDQELNTDSLKRQHILFFEAKNKYQEFSTLLLKQISKESDDNQNSLNDLESQIRALIEILKAFMEQDKLNDEYNL